jgi:NIPSNAP
MRPGAGQGVKGAESFDRGRSEGLGPSAAPRVREYGAGRHGTFQVRFKGGTSMMTLCIRYTLDPGRLTDFEAYAQAVQEPVARCGGKFVAYYLPTKVAGPTNIAFGLIDFPDLAAYEQYREKLTSDAGAVESLRRAEAAGCILNEDRSFVRRVSS